MYDELATIHKMESLSGGHPWHQDITVTPLLSLWLRKLFWVGHNVVLDHGHLLLPTFDGHILELEAEEGADADGEHIARQVGVDGPPLQVVCDRHECGPNQASRDVMEIVAWQRGELLTLAVQDLHGPFDAGIGVIPPRSFTCHIQI